MNMFVLPTIVGACAVTASAGLTTLAEYEINDHPGGNLVPPSYALRLDNTFGLSQATFSAEVYNNALLVVTQDTDSGQIFIDINGTFRGGEDVGGSWDSPFDLEVSFRYEANVVAVADGWAVDGFAVLNSGTFTRLDTLASETMYGLEDSAGDHGPVDEVFRIAADGWRIDGDDDTWVGRGWLTPNDDGSPLHAGGSLDWIFVGKKIPAPSSLALLGVAGACASRRRR